MKVGPKADYPVKVFHEPSQQEPPAAEFYQGIFTVVLNHIVDIRFVPDVSAVAPPWDERALPEDWDEITTAQQARVAAVLTAPYAVTPNDAFASGDEHWVERLPDPDGRPYDAPRVVFYVDAEEFGRYAEDLARLSELEPYRLHATTTVSALREHDVVAFIERRVLASRWLRPQDAAMLALEPDNR